MLPSRDNKKFFLCKSCGGQFVLSNASKMASVVGGMVGMMVGMLLPVQWIANAGHGTKLSIVEGIVVAALTLGFASTTAARFALKLEAKS